jgi:hypothetical protein
MNNNDNISDVTASLVELQQASLAVQAKLESDALLEPQQVPSDEDLQALYSEAIGAATCLLNLAMSAASVIEQRVEAEQPQAHD